MCNHSRCVAGRETPCFTNASPAARFGCVQDDAENEVVASALRILESRLRLPGAALGSPADVKQFLSLKLGQLEHELFVVLFLDAKNRLIAAEELFRGTLTQTAVYPREVVKVALARNAAAVILAHNHPSGIKEPSSADHAITAALKQVLGLIEVRVLDHFIVAGMTQYSFAEHGAL